MIIKRDFSPILCSEGNACHFTITVVQDVSCFPHLYCVHMSPTSRDKDLVEGDFFSITIKRMKVWSLT